MALQCNIDSRGKVARFIYGVVLLFAGCALIWFWAWNSQSIMRWALSIACGSMGAFSIFEARAGWCVIRAIGMKTPM
jgi:hypothetical protein